MVDHTWILSPTMINDFRLNYTRGKFSSTVAPQWDPFGGGANLNTELGLPSILKAGLPALPYIGGQGSTNNNDVEERYDISDTMRITRGNMNWAIGFDVNRAIQNVVPLYAAYGGVYTSAEIRPIRTESARAPVAIASPVSRSEYRPRETQ